MAASEVDMLERPVAGGYRACGTTLDVPLGAFEIATLALVPATPGASARPGCR
jgi:hypothetical protein